MSVLAARAASGVEIAGEGRGIIGRHDGGDLATLGFAYAHAGVAGNVADGNPASRVDTWAGGAAPDGMAYVGVLWASPREDRIVELTVTFATFFDGGWFGPNGVSPGNGGALDRVVHLEEPRVQVSRDRGATWQSVEHTSDYLEALDGHLIGFTGGTNPTAVTATFTLATPVTGVNGVRLIGPDGGSAGPDPGFLGIFEIGVEAEGLVDADADGMDDGWEAEHGLAVGTDDSGLDLDEDGLTNGREFEEGTDPGDADTDADGVTDGDEVLVHGTNPRTADTDGDGLEDGEELALEFMSDPRSADSDGDGLPDGDEIGIHGTHPALADTDDDGFDDGLEIAQATDPTDPASRPANLAVAGTGILGLNDAVDTDGGRAHVNAGSILNLNDGDPATRVDTFDGPGGIEPVSFVGLRWPAPRREAVDQIVFTLAVFFDGGWFGPPGSGPGTGGLLDLGYLAEPTVQVTRDGGLTWESVPHESDYLEALDGHPLPGVDFGPPTAATAVFTLTNPQAGIDGIRLIGEAGGTASGGFLGAFELEVTASGRLPGPFRILSAEVVHLPGEGGRILRLTWPSREGERFTVQATGDLDGEPEPWVELDDSWPAATGAETTSFDVPIPAGANRRYGRVLRH